MNPLNGKPEFLYTEMIPSERIKRLFEELVSPALKPKGFKFLKSRNVYKKRMGIFDLEISYFCSRRNGGDYIVRFDMFMNVVSLKYRKWERDFYNFEKLNGNHLVGGSVESFKNWNSKFLIGGWYDLAKHDNVKLMKQILENIEKVGLEFFSNFESIEKAIVYLKSSIHERKKEIYFFLIFDFYLMENKYEQAVDFFFSNNEQFESELENGLSPYFKSNYIARKAKALEWKSGNS